MTSWYVPLPRTPTSSVDSIPPASIESQRMPAFLPPLLLVNYAQISSRHGNIAISSAQRRWRHILDRRRNLADAICNETRRLLENSNSSENSKRVLLERLSFIRDAEIRSFTGMQDARSREGNPDTAGRVADKRRNDDGFSVIRKASRDHGVQVSCESDAKSIRCWGSGRMMARIGDTTRSTIFDHYRCEGGVTPIELSYLDRTESADSIESSSVSSTHRARIFERTDVGLYQLDAIASVQSNDQSIDFMLLS